MDNAFYQKFQKFRRGHFVRFGLPLILLCVGGSFALTNVQRIKVEHAREKHYVESLKRHGVDLKKPVNWEEELAKMQTVDTGQYENVRGPRFYEENEEWNSKKELQEKRFQEQLQKMDTAVKN